MLALRRGTQHGNVGHNDNIVFGSRRQIFAELVNLAQIVAERAIVVLHNVYLFPRLTAGGGGEVMSRVTCCAGAASTYLYT